MTPATRWHSLCHFYLAEECHFYLALTKLQFDKSIYVNLHSGGLVLSAYLSRWSPHPATAGENGIYSNDCCGTIELAGGDMLLNGRETVEYNLPRNAEGAVIQGRSAALRNLPPIRLGRMAGVNGWPMIGEPDGATAATSAWA